MKSKILLDCAGGAQRRRRFCLGKGLNTACQNGVALRLSPQSKIVFFLVVVWLTAVAAIAQTERITVHMIGDSTMANKPVIPANPERGWGQLLPMYFKDSVRVENYAQNG